MTTQDELLGFVPEKKVTIDESRWASTQRLLARMMVSAEHSLREARLLLSRCRHSPGCPAVVDPTITCLMTCPDRETWLSAKVVENNALEYVGKLGPFSRNHPYSPPTREYWDRIVGELEALRGFGLLEQLAARTPDSVAQLASLPAREQPTHKLVRELELGDDEQDSDAEQEQEKGIAS